jgi:hypothetical protein
LVIAACRTASRRGWAGALCSGPAGELRGATIMATLTISRKAAADSDRADHMVSETYFRFGNCRLTRSTCDMVKALKRQEMQELRGANQGGGSYHAGFNVQGTLYDPEGERTGHYKVGIYPNGAGFLHCTMLLTREERERMIERLQAEHYAYAVGIEECRDKLGAEWVAKMFGNLDAQYAERIVTVGHGYKPQ